MREWGKSGCDAGATGATAGQWAGFELLQVSLGQRDSLSRTPTADEWSSLFDEARRQAVLGILFSGVERLSAGQQPTGRVLRHWAAFVYRIEERNTLWNQRCLVLLRKLSDLGLRATILKGQGMARLYGDMGGRRQSGDIDLFVDGGMENALRKVAPKLGKDWGYKHAELKIWSNTEVELHYRVEFIYSILRNRRLQKWFAQHNEEFFHRSGEWVTPTVEMNLFYILLHIYRHFFFQGVGLRQIVDYYFVLREAQQSSSCQSSLREAVKDFGMERFAKGLMWVMGEAMAMPREWMPWPPDEREGRFILAQVMRDGNFGKHTGKQTDKRHSQKSWRLTLRHSLHLLRRYPAEVLSAPLWMVYLRIWKLSHSIKN